MFIKKDIAKGSLCPERNVWESGSLAHKVSGEKGSNVNFHSTTCFRSFVSYAQFKNELSSRPIKLSIMSLVELYSFRIFL